MEASSSSLPLTRRECLMYRFSSAGAGSARGLPSLRQEAKVPVDRVTRPRPPALGGE